MGQRVFQWASGVSDWITHASAGASNTTLVTAAAAQTIRRIIYDYQIVLSAPADAQLSTGMFGLIVLDSVTSVAGVAANAVPLPINNGDQEWLFTRGYGLQCQTLADSGGQLMAVTGHGDIRTMRKVKQSDVVDVVVQNIIGAAISFNMQVRVLTSS